MVFKTVVTATLVVAAFVRVAAQEPRRLVEAASIPLELASALAATGGFGGEPQILVGAVPDWATSRIVVPQGGTLVGSAFLGSTVVAVVRVPGETDSAIPSLKTELMQRGWKNPPPPPVYGGGGFRPAPVQNQPAIDPTRAVLCGDQQTLLITGNHRRLGGTEIVYRLMGSSAGYSVCHPQTPPTPGYRSPYPTLYNPPNVAEGYMTNGCTLNYSGSGSSTFFRSSLTAETILDHYGRQLVDSGWTTAGTITGRMWTKKDSTGTPMELIINVTPVSQEMSCQRIELQVRTFKKP